MEGVIVTAAANARLAMQEPHISRMQCTSSWPESVFDSEHHQMISAPTDDPTIET